MLFSQFERLKDQKYFKNWTKETVFVYILGFMFLVFLTQRLIYTINTVYDLTLCLAHFLNKIIY